ncbi:hypothetical protein [Saccharicrinis aurantiacus]|uniref:hypothetical protein n=1 Tax=Saccharicrinis aurantiacus TaxID=1849719 RepID=UPI00094F7135|nr:hypothetical protein [Saccharicrinis aurantiacus]
MKYILIILTIVFCTIAVPLYAQSEEDVDLDKINRALDNPLSRYWSLVFQENLTIKTGNSLESNKVANTFFFQPALPVPISKSTMFTARPVFPLVSNPSFTETNEISNTVTGLGDIQLMTLFGPDKKSAFVWGAGLTFIFPSATSEFLGQGKYQMGPSLMLINMTKKWTLGLVGQHWESYAGDKSRQEVSQTDIQYLIRRNIEGKAMSIGVGPTVSVNWNAPSNERLVFPIGLGIVKMVKVSGRPVKIKLEPQYNIIRPESYATSWTFRLQITPVIGSPFI